MGSLIYSAMASAMSEIGAIGKEKVNGQQGFKYRGVDDVMNALQPVLVKNRIFCLPGGSRTYQGGTRYKKRFRTHLFHSENQVHILCRGRFKCIGGSNRRRHGQRR